MAFLCPTASRHFKELNGLRPRRPQLRPAWTTGYGRPAASVRDAGSVETTYLVAESSTLLMGVLLTAFPSAFMGSLVPADAPAFALENGELALRLAAALLFMLATSMAALADATTKGNLTKSATYRRLNTGCMLVCVTCGGLAVHAYVSEAASMRSPALLLALLAYLVPGGVAAAQGMSLQGLLQPSTLRRALQDDVAQLRKQVTSVAATPVGRFYQFEMLASIVVGAALLALPATVMEFPEPDFAAETLMRRIVGSEAALMAVICSVLLDAAERGRLGASTFRALNLASAASVALTAVWLARLTMVASDGDVLSAGAASASAMSTGAGAVALVFGAPALVFAYQGFAAKK